MGVMWYTLITEREVTKMEKFIKDYAQFIKDSHEDDYILCEMVQRVVRLRYRGVITTNECMKKLAELVSG